MKRLGRSRKFLALAVALLLVALSACAAPKQVADMRVDGRGESAASMNVGGNSKYDMDMSAPQATAAPESAEEMGMEKPAADGYAGAYATSSATQPGANQEAKRIYTGDISLTTKAFDDDLARISGMLTDVGGYIQDQELRGDPPSQMSSGNRFIRMTLRVPSERFTTVINSIKSIGSEHTVNTYVNDITSEYYDSSARLKANQLQLARLQDLVSKAEKLSDIVALEQEISRVQYNIESINSQMRRWDSQIALSTITLMMQERTVSVYLPINPTLGERIVAGWVNSVNGVREFIENLSVAMVVLIPVLFVLAIPVVGIALIVRAVRKRRRAKAGT